MFSKSSRLKRIGIWLAIWGFAKAIWDAIGHIGNVQTLWDMVSGAVQYWPAVLRGSAWAITSWWFPLCASLICLLTWYVLSQRESKKKHQAATTVEPLTYVQGPKMPTIPEQDLSYLADPAYDHFWQTSEERFLAKLDALIKSGQSLVQQWTTRLEYPEKQRREHDSKNWLGEANEFAKKHLTSAQMNEFTLRHSTSASIGKKYDFAMALTQAGTAPSSDDGNLAFEIFGKLMWLERFRSEPSPTQTKSRKSRSPAVTKVIDGAMHMITERKVWPLYAMQKAGVGDLDSEEEFSDVREAIIQHGLGDPLAGCWITKEEPKWLDFTKFANRKGLQLSSVSEVLDHLNDYCFGESTRPS